MRGKIFYTFCILLNAVGLSYAQQDLMEMGKKALQQGLYTEALQHFNNFNSRSSDSSKQLLSHKYILDCQFALQALKLPVKFDIQNLGPGVNSKFSEYFPGLSGDGNTLVFTRLLDDNEDFFVSQQQNGQWQEAVPLSAHINSPNYNEGALSLSADGQYLFFTACNRPQGLGSCDIYVSYKRGQNWSNPKNLGSPINSSAWESQPSISADGRTLYFVSNKAGGYGGYDIYKSSIDESGTWTEPENLGPEINTPYNEQTPFIHADGKTLYFSSDGWPGMGNKDIFLSRMDAQGRWGKVQNLGYPINTFAEERGIIVSADGGTAFFSSDITGGYGMQDIYSFKLPKVAQPMASIYIKGRVLDRDTQKPIEALLEIVNIEQEQSVYAAYNDAITGNYLSVLPLQSSYAIHISAKGYLFKSEHLDLRQAALSKPWIQDFYLEKIAVKKAVVLKNIFFETNEYKLLKNSETELLQLLSFMQENPKVHIEVQGHTDSQGSESLNQVLSVNRAKTVFNWLTNNGIPSYRLAFKGYGKQQAQADNSTEWGRQQNRRTSFEVIQY